MADEQIDYNKVIADLKAKREVIDTLIDGFEKLKNIGGMLAMFAGSAASNGDASFSNIAEIPDNAFHGLNIPDAASTLLATVNKPLTGREIAEALERGGFRHTSKNFINTVNTALYRLYNETDPTVVKTGRQWGLREWYPGWRRPRKGDAEPEDISAEEVGATPS